jgi:hypothetical protein
VYYKTAWDTMETTGCYGELHAAMFTMKPYSCYTGMALAGCYCPEYFLLMETIELELVSMQWVAECVVAFVFGRQNEL